ncbi:hypothetical protein [Flavobacterium sp.]|uniref:hypothetical protein n=1 Tax=Flavobacterium sp. TaxID=239 RepID=UPI0026213F1C|nr:hypothetical protein [Flavobacterium sp.]
MRRFQSKIIVLLTVLFCFSCSIEDFEGKTEEELLQDYTERVNASLYRIVDFSENEIDLTDAYTNFVFSFDSIEDKVTATAFSFSSEAPWLFYLDDSAVMKFQFNFTNDSNLERLNGDWSIDSFLTDQFTLVKKDPSTGVSRYVTFKQI